MPPPPPPPSPNTFLLLLTCINFSELLLFSAEDNSSTAFRTKFLRSTRQVLLKKVLDKPSKDGFVGRGLPRMLLKLLCSTHISSAAWKLLLTRPRYLC